MVWLIIGKKFRLRHQLLLYNPHLDEGHFVDEFIAGLRDDIHAAIWLYRPQDLETAHFLALMQEEEAMPSKKKAFSKQDYHDQGQSKWTGSKSSDSQRTDYKKFDGQQTDDKLESLRAFRRSKGLCFTCGEKWSKSHKCPTQVPLHVIRTIGSVATPTSD